MTCYMYETLGSVLTATVHGTCPTPALTSFYNSESPEELKSTGFLGFGS